MKRNVLRVGIVGGNPQRGWAKDAHVPALAALPGFEVAAVSARTQDGADAAADAFGAPAAFGDSLALARSPEVDVVAVCVKVPEHRAVVLAALEAGKHLYCEWPLGRNLAEAEEMAAAARRAGTCAIVGLQGLVAPAVVRALALIAEGALGRLLTLRAFSPTAGWGAEAPPHYAYLQDRETGATLASITAGHTLALIEALAGGYEELDARTSILRRTVRIAGEDRTIERTSPDHMTVIGRHASGCVSTLEVAGGVQGAPFRLQVTGEAGSLTLSGRFPGGYQAGDVALEATVPHEPPQPRLTPALSGPPANVAEAYLRLAQAIESGAPVRPDFDDAVRLTRLLDLIERASADGRRQRIGTSP